VGDYPYVPIPGALKTFLDQIPTTGVPDKLIQAELEARGFKSKNHRQIIPALKFIGFITNDGTPTEKWMAFRDKGQAGAVMAAAVREAYSELFKIHPNANDKDNEALMSFFSTRTKAGARVVDLTISTFKILCGLGDFKAEVPDIVLQPGEPKDKPRAEAITKQVTGQPGKQLVVNINIELQLPATENADIYDKIFEALKKHLL
jgi:Family of unknown function (DUF5343)